MIVATLQCSLFAIEAKLAFLLLRAVALHAMRVKDRFDLFREVDSAGGGWGQIRSFRGLCVQDPNRSDDGCGQSSSAYWQFGLNLQEVLQISTNIELRELWKIYVFAETELKKTDEGCFRR